MLFRRFAFLGHVVLIGRFVAKVVGDMPSLGIPSPLAQNLETSKDYRMIYLALHPNFEPSPILTILEKIQNGCHNYWLQCPCADSWISSSTFPVKSWLENFS